MRFESGLTRAWRVEYAVDGETYRIMPLMNMLTFSPNGTVDVAYDPREPRRAVIDEFSHRGGTMKLIGLIAGVVAAVCAAVSVVMRMAGA